MQYCKNKKLRLFFIIFFFIQVTICKSQVKIYDNGYDVAIFKNNTVILLQEYYFECLDKNDFEIKDKKCVNRKRKKIKFFTKGKVLPTDFILDTLSQANYSEIKKEIDSLKSFDLSTYLEYNGFEIININSIKLVNDTLKIQYYKGSSMLSDFTNCLITDIYNKPNLIITESGLLKIKN